MRNIEKRCLLLKPIPDCVAFVSIRGVYLVRGADWKPAFDVAPDHESYNFSPLNWEKPEDRKLVEDVWKWEGWFSSSTRVIKRHVNFD